MLSFLLFLKPDSYHIINLFAFAEKIQCIMQNQVKSIMQDSRITLTVSYRRSLFMQHNYFYMRPKLYGDGGIRFTSNH